MSVNFKFNKIQLQRTRPEKYKFPIGLSFGFLTPTGNSAPDTEGGLQTCLAGGPGTPGTVQGGNTFHVFANPSGSGTFTPSFTGEVDLLVVAAGGGGGFCGGGGGGGGIAFSQNFPVIADRDYTVTVGAGGALGNDGTPSGSGPGHNGANSSFKDTVTSVEVVGIGGGGGHGVPSYPGNASDRFVRSQFGGSAGGAGSISGVRQPGTPATQPSQNPGISGVSNFGQASGDSTWGVNPHPALGSNGGGGGAGQEGGGNQPTAVAQEIGGKAPGGSASTAESGGTGMNFAGFAEVGVGTSGGFGIGLSSPQPAGFFGGGGGAGGWYDPGDARVVGLGGAGGGGGSPFSPASEPGSTAPNGTGLANTGGGGRGGSGMASNQTPYVINRSGTPSDADGPKAGGSGIVVIKYSTDANAVTGFFIS